MDDRVAQLEQAVADLRRALQETTRRVAELEARAASLRTDDSMTRVEAVAPATDAAGGTDIVTLLSLAGRTCVVLGGAYLLRALTDGGTLPRAGGTALGFAYAVTWLAAAWRGARTTRSAGAAFHVVAAVLIAFPLVWESTVRVQLLAPWSAATAMAGMTSLGLAVSWHRREQWLAWIVSSAGILAALALMAADGTRPLDAASGHAASGATGAPMTLYLAFLGVVTLWFAYRLDWTWLRWPPAIVADFSVLVMTWNAAGVWQRDQAGTVMLVQLVLVAGYLVSFTARTLWRSRRVVPFEVLQTFVLLVVCFGGAVYLMFTTGSNAMALGVASLVFGAGSYAAAFAFIDWRRGHWTNFVFYASLGVVFTIAGTALVAAPEVQAIAWALLALVTSSGGRRYGTITLGSHATIYAIAAGLASGLLAHATEALTAPATVAWTPLRLPAAAALAAAALSSAVRVSSANESWGRCSRVPKVALVVVLLWSAGGTLCGLLTPFVAGTPGSAGADAALLATLRTVILSGAVLILAWAGRGVFVEGRWLTYVVLVVGAVKLLVDDFPNGRPATLFLSLAAYGSALIVGPRLRARARSDPPQPSSRVEPA